MAESLGAERALATFAKTLSYDDVPPGVSRAVKKILMTVVATGIAGSREEGVEALRRHLLGCGGRAEATVWIYGDKLPASSAALINGLMCRALDYCDSIVPGIHIGSSLIPAAFGAAELAGGCTGRVFLAALTAGAEISARLNLSSDEYDGFDPTGVAAVFAPTAAAARILNLSEAQTLNALALAFNRCGGSFQSNVDGSLAVRLIQGWVAESGISCALLARCGLTGPARFLSGIYGYVKLFAKGRRDASSLVERLGQSYRLSETAFKKYPSCGATIGPTELALQIVRETSVPHTEIESVTVHVTPYVYKLVGHAFSVGSNPRVNAQFNIQYCLANAFVRRSSKLRHFRAEAIRDSEVMGFLHKVGVVSAPNLEQRGLLAADLEVRATGGRKYTRGLDVSSVSPGFELSDEEHRAHFDECMDYAAPAFTAEQADRLFETIEHIEQLDDVREVVRQLAAPARHCMDQGAYSS